MFQAAVCDDDEWLCQEVKRILEGHRFDLCDGISVRCYTSGEDLCADLAAWNFDLLILDIELKRMNGIKVAQYVRENLQDNQVQILYISAKEQYCMDLFESRPLQFLVKPIKEKELIRLAQKAVCLSSENAHVFRFQKGNLACRIPYGEILYFESRDKQIRLLSERKEYCFYGKLDDVEKEVVQGGFIRIHKSYLVNYQHIRSYGAECVEMLNGERLSVSRKYHQAAMDRILQYDRRQM